MIRILRTLFADRTEITKEMETLNACMVAFLALLPVWAGDFDIMGLSISLPGVTHYKDGHYAPSRQISFCINLAHL